MYTTHKIKKYLEVVLLINRTLCQTTELFGKYLIRVCDLQIIWNFNPTRDENKYLLAIQWVQCPSNSEVFTLTLGYFWYNQIQMSYKLGKYSYPVLSSIFQLL